MQRIVLLGLFVSIVGCGNKEEPKPAQPNVGGPQTPVQAQTVSASRKLAPDLHKSFKEAVFVETPEETNRPTDKTATGKVVFKMLEQITGVDGKPGLWDEVAFVAPDGKKVRWSALVKTDAGDFRIELLPEAAPNHVRNFLCLAKVGYYDGLTVDRIQNQEIEGKPFRYFEAGCPLSTGDAGSGHIGYWLKPEITEKVKHEEGTVGAWHGRTLETAACKFYITLSKAPWMDGSYTAFGKVTQGLDVARAISERPVGDDERPKDPIVIRQVVVTSTVD